MQAGNVFQFVPDMSSASSAGSDIIKLLDMRPDIDAESNEGKVINGTNVRGHIRLEGVHFQYPTRPGVRVLRDLSLDVEPGTYVALVGASGSGKSTVYVFKSARQASRMLTLKLECYRIQLLERFYDPPAGEIYVRSCQLGAYKCSPSSTDAYFQLDGEKLTNLNVREYRKHLALVSQEPTLYCGTIRFNILLGAIKPHSEVTQDEIEAACRDAHILDFIQSLPMYARFLYTLIGILMVL